MQFREWPQTICPKLASHHDHALGAGLTTLDISDILSLSWTRCLQPVIMWFVSRGHGCNNGENAIYIRCIEMLRVWVSRQSAGCWAGTVFASPCPGSAPAPVFLWTLFIPPPLGISIRDDCDDRVAHWHCFAQTFFFSQISFQLPTLLLPRVLGDLAKYTLHKSYLATFLMLLLMGNSNFFISSSSYQPTPHEN